MTGSAWGQRRVGQEGLPEIFIAPVFLDLSSPGFMRSVAVADVRNERGHILLQGLILGLGTLLKWQLQNQNEGPSGGNTKAERLFRAASAKQAVFTPGETWGFPTPPKVTFTAALGVGEAGVGGGGSGPTLPVASGSGSPFPRCSSKGLKTEKDCSLCRGICTFKEEPRARGGPSSVPTTLFLCLRAPHPGPHPNFPESPRVC